jgi:UDP-2,3-diacylglucosamine pyrophosphatase LpxH
MTGGYSRRAFLQASAGFASAAVLSPRRAVADDATGFSFALLGDLHFDRLEHHDLAWLEEHKPGDLGQIKNYSRITAEIMPRLFDAVRQTVAERKNSSAPTAFVVQVGDLVEGLCGNEELAVRQNQEAVDFVREADLGTPFLFTKGNHDVTGDGATAAFADVFHPFLSQQSEPFREGGKLDQASYSVEHGGAQFCFFDAYDNCSLEWLEATLDKRTAGHCFVVVHPPVVPYGARSTWYLYSGASSRAKREKLLDLLGQHNVVVLGGHLHKYSTLARTTARGGRFIQVAVSSVIGTAEVQPKFSLSGVAAYTGDQVRVEPSYSPETESTRRAVYDDERPFVQAFDYVDHPGYALVTVAKDTVTMQAYSGISRRRWASVDLTRLLSG